MARKGARRVDDPSPAAMPREAPVGPPGRGDGDRWVDEGRVDRSAGRRRGAPPRRTVERVPVVLSGIEGLGESERRRVLQRAGEAAAHFEAERFDDARATLAPLVDRHPEIPELRELNGLTAYRLGRWKRAIAELEAFVDLTGSMDANHVLADSHRALGHHAQVEALWDELRDASPDGELVTEGRIVMAGSLADRGELGAAIALLRKGPIRPKKVKPATLRLWYALGDLLSRSGDLQGAREYLRRVAAHDPDFADVGRRLDELA